MQCDMGLRACMENPAKFSRQTCVSCSMLVKYELGYLLVKLEFHVQLEFKVTIVIFGLSLF